MQRQQLIKPKQRRGRRSWGELLAVWLVLFWGAVSTFLFSINILDSQRSPLDYVALLHGCLCLLGGVSSLLRARTLAKWLLVGAALCVLVLAGGTLWYNLGDWKTILWWGIPMMTLALFLFVLGRWLGRQQDIED